MAAPESQETTRPPNEELPEAGRPAEEPGESLLAGDEQLDLLRDLEASGRFVKDTGLGRILHPGAGKVSYREAVRTNSLHVVVRGNRLDAHIDTVSPLVFPSDGPPRYSFLEDVRYSLPHGVVHNLASLLETAGRLLSGQRTEHRCELLCERVELDDARLADELEEPEPACEAGPAASVAEADAAGVAEAAAGGEAPDEPRRHPFNVVDEAVSLLDTGPMPWSVQLEARVGHLDEHRLRAALATASERHPRGRARRRANPPARCYEEWEVTGEPDVDPLEVVDCPDEAALNAARQQLQSTRVPLDRSPPVRARLARSPDGDVLMLNLSHAASDGFGGLRLLRSIARAYEGAADPVRPHDQLTERTLPVRLAQVGTSTRLRRYLALAERGRDLAAPPARVAPVAGAAPRAGDDGYGFHHVALGKQASHPVLGGDRRGSVNDVLVAALHLTVGDWNARHQASCRRVTVLVPSNLRPPRWREEAVGNFSVPARITTTPRQRTTAAAALDAVVDQTSRKKQSGMGTALLQLLDQSQRLPLRLKRAGVVALDRAGSRLVDTVVLSNLGDVEPPSFGEDAGEATELWFSAPTRMPLGVSIGALTVAGRLHLVFRYDRRVFDDAAARRFADAYLARLRDVSRVTGR